MELATQDTRTIFELANPGITQTFKNPLWSQNPAPMRAYVEARLKE